MRALLAALLALTVPPAAAQQPEPGTWQLEITAMMTGLPKPMAMTQTKCLDTSDPAAVLGGTQAGACEFTNKSDSGGLFTFELACAGALPMKGKGRVNYTASTMNADLDLEADGGKLGVRTFVTARRLGPC